MPILSPLVLIEIVSCTAIWLSGCSLNLKILLTALSIVQVILILVVIAFSHRNMIRNAGALLCIALEIAKTAIACTIAAWSIVGISAFAIALMLIWYIAMAIEASKRSKDL